MRNCLDRVVSMLRAFGRASARHGTPIFEGCSGRKSAGGLVLNEGRTHCTAGRRPHSLIHSGDPVCERIWSYDDDERVSSGNHTDCGGLAEHVIDLRQARAFIGTQVVYGYSLAELFTRQTDPAKQPRDRPPQNDSFDPPDSCPQSAVTHVDVVFVHPKATSAGMPDAMTVPVGSRRLPRDSRVDALRGIALIMIFIDHVPGNVLGLVTLRNFGFADSAELFVLLAGFASIVAYGVSFDRGVLPGLRRVLLRCVRLYLFQVILLLAVLVGVGEWIRYFGIGPESGAPFVHSGLNGLRHGLMLQALPASLNVLPLYIVLLACFPLIYGLIVISPLVALLASCALWVCVNLDPSINLTNWLDGRGWFFDPFAWQFLFVIGALGALLLRRYGGNLPRPLWLRAVAWGYLGFALVATAPWDSWGWSSYHPIALDTPDKTVLAPVRLLNVVALAALALSSVRFRVLAERPALRVLVVCGRNSLEVFALGTMLAILCRLVFRTFGVTWATQLLANGIGIGLMIAVAFALEHVRRPIAAKRLGDARQQPTAGAKKSLANTSVV
jgi:hypothetical protein